jgi:hypothetical protein
VVLATVLAEVPVLETVPAAVLELVIARRVQLETVPAAVPELAIDRVAALALEIAPELGLDLQTEHLRARLVGRAKIKLATAPLPRGQVPLLAVGEDSAAAAETMRKQAATEAAVAWVAAVTAVVAVAVE